MSASVSDLLSKALKLTNNENRFVKDIVSQHMVPHDQLREEILNDPRKLRQFKDENSRWKFIYMQAIADSMAKSKVSAPADERYQQYIGFMQGTTLPVLLNGNEVMQITGLTGPAIGEVLKKIRKQQYTNFGLGGHQEIPIDQARQFAVQIAKSFIKPHLNGNEIMQITGLKPGPEIGQVRQRLITEQSNNPAFSRVDAINLVQQMYPQTQLPPEQV